MNKSFLIFDTLSKSLVSLRFLDKGSKRLIRILGFQFVLGSLIESFALTFIYKLFNLIFFRSANFGNNPEIQSEFNNFISLPFNDLRLLIIFTIFFIVLSGTLRTFILRRIYKNVAIIAHKLSCEQIILFNRLDYNNAREIEPSKWLTHNQFIYTYTSSILQPLLQIFSSFILGITILLTILFLYKIYFITILLSL